MKMLLISSAVVGLLTAGCAADNASTASDNASVREYPTGSNIPRKRSADQTDGVSTYDRDALDRARSQVPQAPRPGLGGTP